MSWDASFYIRGESEWHAYHDWNYTHNTNAMISATLDGARPWWYLLHEASGTEGATLLNRIITGLRAEPERFRAMNPENGWGDYDQLLWILQEMRAVSEEFPHGKWGCSG